MEGWRPGPLRLAVAALIRATADYLDDSATGPLVFIGVERVHRLDAQSPG